MNDPRYAQPSIEPTAKEIKAEVWIAPPDEDVTYGDIIVEVTIHYLLYEYNGHKKVIVTDVIRPDLNYSDLAYDVKEAIIEEEGKLDEYEAPIF
jgi:hypothetical protein